MTPRFTREQIIDGVRIDVADCMAIEPDEITMESNFFNDLGGESIDTLDLAFRSEKRFGIRSPFQRLSDPDAWKFNLDGSLSSDSMQRLTLEFPGIDWQTRRPKRSEDGFKSILTIEVIVEAIYRAQFRESTADSTVPS